MLGRIGVLAVLVMAGCSSPPPGRDLLSSTAPAAGFPDVVLERAYPKLTFERPVDVAARGTDLYVVEQRGRIRKQPTDGDPAEAPVWLELTAKVAFDENEMGLLGLAFHPAYETNGYFYLNYTADGPRRTVISRFQAKAGVVDAASETVLLTYTQPYANHNGGQLVFGPDGFLYIASGDGGSGGDPEGNGQNKASLLGKLLRIDVDKPDAGKAYGIPADNPFAAGDGGARPEIYAYGLRNPWRFSFDLPTGHLYAADVGQNAFEEIDIVTKGGNYGWNVMEGNACYKAPTCDPTGFVAPIWTYDREQGKSITGGFVYRGSKLPGLVGAYVYADFVSGRVWGLRNDGTKVTAQTNLVEKGPMIASFGVDQSGELIAAAFDGFLYRFAASKP